VCAERIPISSQALCKAVSTERDQLLRKLYTMGYPVPDGPWGGFEFMQPMRAAPARRCVAAASPQAQRCSGAGSVALCAGGGLGRPITRPAVASCVPLRTAG
jgi:hypothetical protein